MKVLAPRSATLRLPAVPADDRAAVAADDCAYPVAVKANDKRADPAARYGGTLRIRNRCARAPDGGRCVFGQASMRPHGVRRQ